MTSSDTLAPPRLYKTLGTTEDWDSCDCCGRANLKVYVVMENLEDGEVCRFGTGCAAKLEQVPATVIKAEGREADRARREAERAEQAKRQAAETADWFAFLDREAGPGEVIDQYTRLGGLAAARAAWRAQR